MMSPSEKASTPPVRESSRWRSLFLPLAFVGVGVLVALVFGYLQATVVKGSEFNTGTWQVRSFWYRRDPFSGKQLTGILKELPTAMVSSSTNFPNSYFGGPSSSPPRQDLVSLRSGTVVTAGPANVLHTYLDGYAAEQLWPTWSTANTAKAHVLWPAARDLVDLGLYHELPNIMELAKVDSSNAEFQSMVEEQMLGILRIHCEKLRVAEKEDELSTAEAIFKKYSTSVSSGLPS